MILLLVLLVSLIDSSMGRGKAKGKKFTLTNNDDVVSGDDEKIPAQKRRGRPQKPLSDEVEDDVEKIEEEEEDDENANSDESGKRRKRNKEGKEKGNLVKVENPNGTLTNSFRHIGSRRKNKPHRAAEAGVACT